MTSKKELKISIILALVLFILSVVSYKVFPASKPDKPVRTMFKCVAGKVLFTHKNHFSDSGYSIACTDCHHHHEEDESDYKPCSTCHSPEIGINVPSNCLECHEPNENHHPGNNEMDRACSDCHTVPEDGSLPASCSECHDDPDEIAGEAKSMNFYKRSDAFHKQCIGCHKSGDAGPVDCSSCHVI
ncbi:MAG: cytochrome c family protein [Proteobacteria bacterium]|nr:cytochrome c family protein [Pseudomonadota bacterium]